MNVWTAQNSLFHKPRVGDLIQTSQKAEVVSRKEDVVDHSLKVVRQVGDPHSVIGVATISSIKVETMTQNIAFVSPFLEQLPVFKMVIKAEIEEFDVGGGNATCGEVLDHTRIW